MKGHHRLNESCASVTRCCRMGAAENGARGGFTSIGRNRERADVVREIVYVVERTHRLHVSDRRHECCLERVGVRVERSGGAAGRGATWRLGRVHGCREEGLPQRSVALLLRRRARLRRGGAHRQRRERGQ
eukprot:1436336-Pleurochrysis_carterae.AAC.2